MDTLHSNNPEASTDMSIQVENFNEEKVINHDSSNDALEDFEFGSDAVINDKDIVNLKRRLDDEDSDPLKKVKIDI